jgi:hypothetical protein
MTFLFLSVSYITTILIIFLMKKRITKQEIISTACFVSLVTIVSDLYFGEILDLYDLMKPGPQVSDMIFELTLPATFGIIYANFMPKKIGDYIWYLIFWVFFSVLYEQLSRYFGYVIYKGWKVHYSFVFYIFACLFTRWYFFLIMNNNKK